MKILSLGPERVLNDDLCSEDDIKFKVRNLIKEDLYNGKDDPQLCTICDTTICPVSGNEIPLDTCLTSEYEYGIRLLVDYILLLEVSNSYTEHTVLRQDDDFFASANQIQDDTRFVRQHSDVIPPLSTLQRIEPALSMFYRNNDG